MTRPAPPRLEVRRATVRYGELAAIDGFGLEVPPGQIVAVLGPSGSGKSTLLRAIAGLEPLDSGAVLLDGVDQQGVATHRRDVGLMFQDHALFPHADVGGNVAFGLRMHGVRRPDAAVRVRELLELVGLGGAERRAVTTLSGGEQQRVALARALAPSPRLLMLDEPLGALDRLLRERLVVELRQLFTSLGQTVLAVTHDQAEAFALADRVVVMARGHVLQEGPPSEVWAAPASAEVAQFLGFENVVDVEVRSGIAGTPWGEVPVESPDGAAAVLIRPHGVVMDPGGPIEATVAALTFRGATVSVRLDPVDGPPLVAEVPTPAAPAVGTTTRARLVPSEVIVLRPT